MTIRLNYSKRKREHVWHINVDGEFVADSERSTCIGPTGAALHENNEASAKVTTQYGRR